MLMMQIQLLLILSFTLLVYGGDIILKLDTKQIFDSILSEASVKYLTKLAQVFAKKAAETFIEEIKNKERLLAEDTSRAKNTTFTKKPFFKIRTPTTTTLVTKEDILNEEEAHILLEEPSPDGDHLGWHSEEATFDKEEQKETKTIPVYGLLKVNGVYVRRLGVGLI